MSDSRVVFIHDLPVNASGRTTPQLLAQLLGTEHLLNRPHVTIYSGARPGNKPIYMEETKRLSALLQKNNIVVNNGGGSSGLMGAATCACTDVQCFQTAIFYGAFGAGGSEGPNQTAINGIAQDFFTRKVALMAFSKVSCALPGGIGTIEESTEDMSFCAKRNRKIYYLNLNGFWDNFGNQLEYFLSNGLMPKHYANHYSFVSTPEDFMARAEKELLSPKQLAAGIAHERPTAKPTMSTRQFLDENLAKFICTLQRFIAPASGQRIESVPRIGVFASSNMGKTGSAFNISDQKLRNEICKNARKLGEDLAKTGAVTIISGSNEGLRKIVAEGALTNGGRVIWVRKAKTDQPLSVRHKNDQELVLSMPRHYEKDMVMSLLCESYVAIAGGIHTADQVIGHMTRNQTGHGVYSELYPECYDPKAAKPVIMLYDPLLPGGQKSLWGPLNAQINHGINEGFISKNDLSLLQSQPSVEGMAEQAVKESRNHPNYLFQPLSETMPPKTPEAKVLTQIVRHAATSCLLT